MSGLRAEHIQKRFGPRDVLCDVSVEFSAGTVTAIVGDNGAGKSTLLKTLAGVLRPDAGYVSLGGKQLSGTPEGHRQSGVEMVYQDFALAKNHDIVTNLFIGREPQRVGLLDRSAMFKKSTQILSELGAEIHDLHSPVRTLSGGLQQLVAIARAILFDPQVILLDEPTAALAAREVDRVLGLIQSERAKGRTILLVSHRLNDVFQVADRILVMKHGKIFSDDPAGKLTLAEVVQRIVSH